MNPGNISHYRILRRLGAGGMGEVYLAEDTKLRRNVAIKVLPNGATADEQARKRLLKEARATAILDHPNICSVYEVGEDGSFIVMQYVEGETLASRLQAHRLTTAEVLEIAAQIADALAEAHAHRIIHRDLKPQNIMLTPRPGVKVLDFGLAKQMTEPGIAASEAETASASIAATVVGTVPYMSPEQVRGQELDARSDVFSFGAVLYEMVTGRRPFTAPSMPELFSDILTREPVPAEHYAAETPAELLRILGKCLQKDRGRRYQSTHDLAVDLRSLQQQISTTASRTGRLPAWEPRKWRRRAVVVAILLLGLAAGLWGAWLATRGNTIRSIAVLPFEHSSEDPDLDFVSDGITDNLIERLWRLPGLTVIGHAAVFRYKERTIDELSVGRELGVQSLLLGRVVKQGDTLNIRLELVEAKDGRVIWKDQYEGKYADLLALQREIPADVAAELRLQLSGEAQERLTRMTTSSSEAYELYLKGRYSWEKWTVDGSRQAIEYFQEAIKKDANFAAAYSGLADAYIWGARVDLPQKETHRRAREAALKALELDATLGEAHASLGLVLLYDDWDFAASERELIRAMNLSPSYAEGYHQYSHLMLLLGRVGESLSASKRFLELDPVSESPIGHLGWHYLYARQYDDAIKQYQKDLELHPDAIVFVELGHAYYQKGMFREAVEAYLKAGEQNGQAPEEIAALKEAFAKSGIRGYLQKRLQQLQSGGNPEVYAVRIAALLALLGEKDKAFDWLEKAYAQHWDGLVTLKQDFFLDSLRTDPRFKDLLRRVGLEV